MNTVPYITRLLVITIASIVADGNSLASQAAMKPESATRGTGYRYPSEQLDKAEFSGAIAIINPNGESIFLGFGENATADGKPDQKTLIDIGSISKTITAVAALSLVDQGKLSLNDRLSDFFPYAPKDKLDISLHQLLTHSSGLPHHIAEDGDGISKQEFLKRTMDSSLLFQPGEKYHYSNVGYSLVAAIIEQRSNTSYEEFIRQTVLKNTENLSIGYEGAYVSEYSMLTPNGEAIDQNSWGGSPKWELIGNGGLVSRPLDLALFFRKLNDGEIISFAALEFMKTPHIREGDGAPSYYGYGLVVEDHPRYGRTYWHNGSNGIYSATWAYYADHEFIIVSASNDPKLNSDKAISIILKGVLPSNISDK